LKAIEDVKMRLLTPLVLLGLLVSNLASAAPDAQLRLPKFEGLAEKATESVNINLDENLLKMAGRFLSSDDPKDAEVNKLLQGLRGIYVKSFTFNDGFTYPQAEIESLRKQVSNAGWAQLVDVRNSKEQTQVGIYVSLGSDNKANGLVIIATEPREFTVVNIVGAIDLVELKKLEGKFGIPKVDVEPAKSQKK
jgi:hypothetical protein